MLVTNSCNTKVELLNCNIAIWQVMAVVSRMIWPHLFDTRVDRAGRGLGIQYLSVLKNFYLVTQCQWLQVMLLLFFLLQFFSFLQIIHNLFSVFAKNEKRTTRKIVKFLLFYLDGDKSKWLSHFGFFTECPYSQDKDCFYLSYVHICSSVYWIKSRFFYEESTWRSVVMTIFPAQNA